MLFRKTDNPKPYRKNKVYPDQFYKFRDFIETIMSTSRGMLCGSIINRYLKYAIDAILHGYVINIPNVIKISFIKIPIKEFNLHRLYKFKSSFTSDWVFAIDIIGPVIERGKYRYTPSKNIRKQINEFINSEKVYELIR